jgi:hypothetical protein
MTDTVTFTATAGQLAYTFGGRPPVARLRPGDVLRVDTEDCFGGAVRGNPGPGSMVNTTTRELLPQPAHGATTSV